MVRKYTKPLRVATPEGRRIIAFITQMDDNIRIEVPYLEVVEKDNAPFSDNGIIRFNIPRKQYAETIQILTKYIEDLFLKGMADEDIYRSLGAEPPTRRTPKPDTTRKIIDVEGKRDSSSLHISPRGSEPTKSVGGRKSNSKVAKGDDSGTEGSD